MFARNLKVEKVIYYRFTTYQDARRVRLVDGLETNILRVSPVKSFIINGQNPSYPKDWLQNSWGPDQFPTPKSPSENNYSLFNSRF